MRVFISHSSQDKPQVEAPARSLRERGIDARLNKWELQDGDNLVASINRGLDEAQAGLVFSEAATQSIWVKAETSYLIQAATEEGGRSFQWCSGRGSLARRGFFSDIATTSIR